MSSGCCTRRAMWMPSSGILARRLVGSRLGSWVVLKLKTAWRDGTTYIVMSPLEFMQRLAALVPRPRLHLIRFHGCWRRMPN